MIKYNDKDFVKELDTIILLNDNYASKGLYKGYVGTVMENLISQHGYVVADFSNPITGESIQPVAIIKKADFKVCADCIEDKKIIRDYRALFKNNK